MKSNKKIICFCILFLIIAVSTFILYKHCKYINNYLWDEILKTPFEDSLLGENNEMISKAMLHYKLGNVFKYVSIGSFSASIILSCIIFYIKMKLK